VEASVERLFPSTVEVTAHLEPPGIDDENTRRPGSFGAQFLNTGLRSPRQFSVTVSQITRPNRPCPTDSSPNCLTRIVRQFCEAWYHHF
jgi:hypothetical protein